MATSERSGSVLRTYGAVRLDQLDPQEQRLMQRLTREATEFGAEIVGFPYGAQVASLAEGIAKELIDGTARDGLAMDRLCRGRTSPGRMRERFAIEPLQDLVELGSRALLLRYGFPAVHEHVTSVPVRPGKDMHGYAIDQIPHMSRMGHLLLSSVGSDDRTLLTQAQWLTTGTEDDHSCARANPRRIARWSKELEKEPAGSICEHLELMFAAQRRARRQAFAAAARGSKAFEKFGISGKAYLELCFPRCVILGTFSSGPPTRSGASSGKVVFPGDQEDIVEVVKAAGRYGIALCKIEEQAKLDAIEQSLLPELAVRFGEEPRPVPVSVLEDVASWKTAADLGIGVSVRVIRYWHFKEAGYLLRAAQVPGRDGAQIYDVHLWRTIRLDSSLLRETITLVERAQQPWPGSCVDRYREECEPARMSTWTARKREGLLKTTLPANAAGVTAHRVMEARHAAEDSQRAPVRKTRD